MKKIIALLLVLAMGLSLGACESAEDKKIAAAQVTVDGFMAEFCTLNLKGMADYTDANIDYSEVSYLSLDEYKERLFSKFAVLKAIGIPVEGFEEVIDSIFVSYQQKASYKITNAEVRGNDVVFTLDIEYITAESMENILTEAINDIDAESLGIEVAAALVLGGLMGGSVQAGVEKCLVPVIETLKVEVNREIEELTPVSGTITLVVYESNGGWVISNQQSDSSGMSRLFERTTTN